MQKHYLAIYPICFFFIIIFSYIFLINHLTPFMGDDWNFLIPNTQNWLSSVIKGMDYWYFNQGGRLTVYLLTYIVFVNSMISNLLNSLVFCFLIYMIFLCSNLRRPSTWYDLTTLSIIFFLLWFFLGDFGEICFWKICAIGYLLSVTGTLCLLYPLLQLLNNKDIISGYNLRTISLIVMGFIFSLCLENLSATICVFFTLYLFLYGYLKKRPPNWVILTSFSYFLGSLVLFLSPGNSARIKRDTITHLTISQKIWPFTEKIYHHFVTGNVWINLVFSWPLALLLIAGFFIFLVNKSSKNFLFFIIFFLLSICSAYAMIGAPQINFQNRTVFTTDVFFITAFCCFLRPINPVAYWKKFYYLLPAISLIVLIPSMYSNYTDTKSLYTQMMERKDLLKIYLSNNTKTAIFNPLYLPSTGESTGTIFWIYHPHLINYDIRIDPLAYPNTIFSRYYGFEQSHLSNGPYILLKQELKSSLTQQNISKKNFTLFVRDNSLFYFTKKSCENILIKNPFFLQVYPKTNIFSRRANPKIVQALDFTWEASHQVEILSSKGKIINNICILRTQLPNYSIDKIETGQYKLLNSEKQIIWKTILEHV